MNLNNIKGREKSLPYYFYFLKRYYNIEKEYKSNKKEKIKYVESKKKKEI